MNSENAKSKIKVLIVDDSAFMRTALSRMVANDPDLLVVGSAASGNEALERIEPLDPDVITLDVEMPGLNGLETLRCIMARFPRPVIMVSSVTVKDADTTFSALEAGAFDYVPKQLASTSLDILHIREDLIAKIKAAAETRRSKQQIVLPRKPPRTAESTLKETAPHALAMGALGIVAIGISTGGPKALQEILPTLPADFSVPILVVQHMPSGFTGPFAKRLDGLCAASVREASQGETLQTGAVYIAPGGRQMTVDRSTDPRGTICLSDTPVNQLHIPSVDVMMQSVAAAYGPLAMGVIMTGMGSDGAEGMSAIQREGGFTLGQDESTCAVYGMPRVCAEMGILKRVVPLSRITYEILQATRYRKVSVG